jgi:hypothetical protein
VYNLGLFGLIYPSTKMEGSGLNIVLKPEIVDNCLELKRAGECTIYRKNGIDVSHDRITSLINSDGSFDFDREGDGRGHIGSLKKLGAKTYYQFLSDELSKNNYAAIAVNEKLKKMFNTDEITLELLEGFLNNVEIDINIQN